MDTKQVCVLRLDRLVQRGDCWLQHLCCEHANVVVLDTCVLQHPSLLGWPHRLGAVGGIQHPTHKLPFACDVGGATFISMVNVDMSRGAARKAPKPGGSYFGFQNEGTAMQHVYVVTALEWDGERIVRAEVGEAEVAGPSWKSPPRVVSFDGLIELIEKPDTLVTSRHRSGTAGPNLRVHTAATGAQTVRVVQVPGVIQDLDVIPSILK
ncbi:hypothetical protein [Variovorax boronicumulans]|uniref:hypothetical protein n=1 Tax=Variovorax boronicumulans TaxID=436515 RepID=UPI00209C168D|nr:hypothetical protein [Variovorax boronicumulans]